MYLGKADSQNSDVHPKHDSNEIGHDIWDSTAGISILDLESTNTPHNSYLEELSTP